MTDWFDTVVAVTIACYAIAIAIGGWRLLRGPSAEDRVLAGDFMYVVGMLLILVYGLRFQSAMYFEAALIIGLLGWVSTAALAKFLLRGEVIE